METTCAVCRLSDGLVTNIIVAAPSDLAPDDCQLIQIAPSQHCDIGWTWNLDAFVGPLVPISDAES